MSKTCDVFRTKTIFSVVIPIYNHSAFLDTCIQSALESELVAEVLLLDDGSTDGSDQIAAGWARRDNRVRDLTTSTNANLGAHNRLNSLVEAACCDWISVLNSDDVFVPGRFEAMVSDPAFEQSSFVFGDVIFINAAGIPIGAKFGPLDPLKPLPAPFDGGMMVRSGRLLELLFYENYIISTSNMTFRKSLHSQIGGFASYRYVHDWDFALRAMIQGRPLYLQAPLTHYRKHPANTVNEGFSRVEQEVRVLFKHLSSDYPDIATSDSFCSLRKHSAIGSEIP